LTYPGCGVGKRVMQKLPKPPDIEEEPRRSCFPESVRIKVIPRGEATVVTSPVAKKNKVNARGEKNASLPRQGYAESSILDVPSQRSPYIKKKKKKNQRIIGNLPGGKRGEG